jgi:hypothetical protein
MRRRQAVRTEESANGSRVGGYRLFAIGISPVVPHWCDVDVLKNPVLDCTMNHTPAEGRNTATSVFPSPS